jgi:hypothetical protein
MFKYARAVAFFGVFIAFGMSIGCSISDRATTALQLEYKKLKEVLAQEKNYTFAALVLSHLDAAYGYVLNTSRRPKNYSDLDKQFLLILQDLNKQLSSEAADLVFDLYTKIVRKIKLLTKLKAWLATGSAAIGALFVVGAYIALKKMRVVRQTYAFNSSQERALMPPLMLHNPHRARVHIPIDINKKKSRNLVLEMIRSSDSEAASKIATMTLSAKQKEELLFYALTCGASAVIKVLINLGTNVNVKNNNQNTPLLLLVKDSALFDQQSGREILSLLLKKGAPINDQDAEGDTALHHAVMIGRDDLIDVLLEHNASCNVVNNKGEKAFHIAIKYNKPLKLLQKLIYASNLSDAELAKSDGVLHETVWQTAKKLGRLDILDLLKTSGFNELGSTADEYDTSFLFSPLY